MNAGYDNPISAYLFSFSPGETVQDIANRLRRARSLGYRQIIVTYSSKQGHKQVAFDDQYWSALDALVEACRGENMPFWLPDFTCFPTGNPDNGLVEHPELNKIFLDERHIDFCGPLPGATINIDQVRRIAFGKALHRFENKDISSRKEIALIACRLHDNPENAAAPFLDEDTFISLEKFAKDGYLTWDVPEGRWRVFTLFTTRETSGRSGFVNLLSRESVALEIDRVHRRIYEHLKPVLGKLWYGFFYDEPEAGNDGGEKVFDFFMLPGKRSKFMDDCEVYSWSPEMPEELAKRDADWNLKLPCIFYDGIGDTYKDFRFTYMDAVSSLIAANYAKQVYAFCRERGIYYFGHSLEDENSHARLGCGLGHYFRHQYYQDEAGIDVIAGQILPGRDQAVTWYGVANADGEFYHYGLSKLASSEAHITPHKHGRSIVECFALYGQQGLAERKFVLDHIMVNGVNRLYLMDEGCYTEPMEYTASLIDYSDQICGVMYTSQSEIRTAILYHAEAEWREGEKAQKFQKPAAALAREQISYDIIPADVFEFPEKYHTVTDKGLQINGHSYGAFIVPACEKLPKAIASFIRTCDKTGFPVFFVDRVPKMFAANTTPTPLSELPNAVRRSITPDIVLESAQKKWFRYLHVTRGEEEFYLIHNEAPMGGAQAMITLPTTSEIFWWDVPTRKLIRPAQEQATNGTVRLSLRFGQYEMKILYLPNQKEVHEPVVTFKDAQPHVGAWEMCCPDGSIKRAQGNVPPRPETYAGPGVYGRFVYTTTAVFCKKRPCWLDLGAVSDCCEVFLNEQSLGKRSGTPYLFELKDVIREGKNEVRIELYTSASNIRTEKAIFGIPVDSLSGVPYSLVLPMGLQGPIQWLYSE